MTDGSALVEKLESAQGADQILRSGNRIARIPCIEVAGIDALLFEIVIDAAQKLVLVLLHRPCKTDQTVRRVGNRD